MKKFLVGSVMTVLCSTAAWAAPIQSCDSLTTNTLAFLISLGSSGCQHQDKIFNNFAFVGAENTNNIAVVHEFSGTVGGGLNDVHGWSFSLPGGFATGFTLSYDITVDTNCLTDPNCGPAFGIFDSTFQRIYATVDQQQSGLTPNNTAVTDTETIAGVLHTFGTNVGQETAQLTYTPVTTLHTSSQYTTSGGSLLQSWEQNFFETNVAIPEPATLAVCGGALVLLGFLKKRRA